MSVCYEKAYRRYQCRARSSSTENLCLLPRLRSLKIQIRLARLPRSRLLFKASPEGLDGLGV